MFSICFLAQVKPCYLEYIDKLIQEKRACLELLIEEAKQRDNEDCVILRSVDHPGRDLNQLLRSEHFQLAPEETKTSPR